MQSSSPNSAFLEMPVHSLRPGMYVAELDRPWLDTPFALQGFYVNSDDDIVELAEHCNMVYVDPRRAKRKKGNYQPRNEERLTLQEEFAAAKINFESAGIAVRKVFSQLESTGSLDVASVESAVTPLIRSVVNHKDATAALTRMRRKDDYLYNHSIATAVWATLIGQHLGLDRESLKALALGAAMLDLGKVQLPTELLHKPGRLSEHERGLVESHVTLGIKLATEGGAFDPMVIEVIKHHHERFDGSGYPDGLVGNKIPLLAQIAGLADSYDAMLTPRPYAQAHTSFSAVQELIDLQDMLFGKPLIEQFVQAVGMFPTGCLVELNTGEVGIVVAQNAVRRLRPKIMLVLDRGKERVPELVTVDLMKYEGNGPEAQPLWITKELESGAYGLSAAEFFL